MTRSGTPDGCRNGAPLHSIDAAVAFGAGVFILAVVMTGAAAVLGVIWLNERRWLRLGKLLVFGAVIGNLPFALIVAGVIVAHLVGGVPTGDISQILVRPVRRIGSNRDGRRGRCGRGRDLLARERLRDTNRGWPLVSSSLDANDAAANS